MTYSSPTWLQGDYDKNGSFETPKVWLRLV